MRGLASPVRRTRSAKALFRSGLLLRPPSRVDTGIRPLDCLPPLPLHLIPAAFSHSYEQEADPKADKAAARRDEHAGSAVWRHWHQGLCRQPQNGSPHSDVRERLSCFQHYPIPTELRSYWLTTTSTQSNQDSVGLGPGQTRTEQVRSGQVRSGQVRSGQVRSGQVRSGQARSLQVSRPA